MNHLRELLEHAESGTLLFNDTLSHQHAVRLDSITRKIGEEAVCFHMGNVAFLEQLDIVPALVRLPYERCYFEANIEPDGDDASDATQVPQVMAVLAAENVPGNPDPREILMIVATRCAPPVKWRINGGCVVKARDGEAFVQTSLTGASQKIQDFCATIVCTFLSALNCTNVQRTETLHTPALQKARERRGKKPLFSTWTLRINFPKGAADRADFGGTRASPRIHLRRGHAVQFAPGKWTWRRAHVAGRAHGLIHKDYAAKHAGAGEPPPASP